MSKSIEMQVLDKIKQSPKGTLFFVDSFATIANAKAKANKIELWREPNPTALWDWRKPKK